MYSINQNINQYLEIMGKYVTVRVLYGGEPLSKKYYEEHPEIHNLYPSQKEFMKTYLELRDRAISEDTIYVFEITENEINTYEE